MWISNILVQASSRPYGDGATIEDRRNRGVSRIRSSFLPAPQKIYAISCCNVVFIKPLCCNLDVHLLRCEIWICKEAHLLLHSSILDLQGDSSSSLLNLDLQGHVHLLHCTIHICKDDVHLLHSSIWICKDVNLLHLYNSNLQGFPSSSSLSNLDLWGSGCGQSS
jgi:hypothetical protein